MAISDLRLVQRILVQPPWSNV